jgi:hypothetical protein
MRKRILISVGLVAGLVFAGWLIQQNPRPAIAIHNLLSPEEPPFWLQRLEQRREVYARVQSSGGWEALKSDCLLLLQTNQNSKLFFWDKWETNQPVLPSAIGSLKPMFVQVYSPEIVTIQLYGMGESRHRGVAIYGLEVICAPSTNRDEPKLYPVATHRKIQDGVYEYY